MAKWSSQEINLNQLQINTENPRFDSVKDQDEAIKTLLSDQGDKILNLAEDIVNHGLNPTDITIVSPSTSASGMYNVLEGNRRVTSIKLLQSPNLAASQNAAFVRKLRQLANAHSEIKKIQCIVFENPEDANRWIKLKHTGQNDGVGTVGWDSQMVARFEANDGGTSSVALQALDFLKNSKDVKSDLKSKLGRLPITSLDRLIKDKGVRDLLGVSISQGKLKTHISESEVAKGLSKIAEDLVSKKVKVKDIYTKKDRDQYIETFKKNEIPQKNDKLSSPKDLVSGSRPSKISKVVKRSVPLSTSRKAIIPKDCIISISEKKINKIYSELKNLNCDDFENAAAVLMRVFLELSADAYLSKNKIRNLNKDSELNKKIYAIAVEFENLEVLSVDELKGIRTATSNQNSIFSTHTFNSYVHNKHFSPISKDLKSTWDNIQIFVEKLWEKI